MQAEFEKLGELIKDIRIAMVTTVESDGKAAYLLGVAKAAVTGKRSHMGENRKLTM